MILKLRLELLEKKSTVGTMLIYLQIKLKNTGRFEDWTTCFMILTMRGLSLHEHLQVDIQTRESSNTFP